MALLTLTPFFFSLTQDGTKIISFPSSSLLHPIPPSSSLLLPPSSLLLFLLSSPSLYILVVPKVKLKVITPRTMACPSRGC
jgi:hypothetical protein